MSEGTTFSMSVQATNKNKISVKVNNKSIYNGDAGIEMKGRMGFLQSGSCEAEIEDVNIISYAYDTPSNTNLVEDFESGSMNKNTLTSTMTRPTGYLPSGIMVEEYNGSNVLMFHNVIDGSFGTLHQYSNFELTVDVPYNLYSNKIDEDGDLVAQENAGFVIGIGDDTDAHASYGYHSSADGVVCELRRIYNLKNDVSFVLPETGFYDEENNVGYSVKVSVIDTEVNVWVIALKATNWTHAFTYSLGDSTPSGFIHIWATGRANFGIDNFKITNKDEKGNVQEVPYDAYIIPEIDDWEYEPMKVEYIEAENTETKFNYAWLLAYAGIAAVVILAGCIVVSKVSNRPKKKEVDVHEK